MNKIAQAQEKLDAARLASRRAHGRVAELEADIARLNATRDETSPSWQAEHDATMAALVAARGALPDAAEGIRAAELELDRERIRKRKLAGEIDATYAKWSGVWLNLDELERAAEHLARVALAAQLPRYMVAENMPPLREHLRAAKTARLAVKALERQMLTEYDDDLV